MPAATADNPLNNSPEIILNPFIHGSTIVLGSNLQVN